MSTTSPNFNLVIATTADTVNVVTQIANNFTSLDSILAVAHTGTGQLKAGLALQTPSLTSPTITGTATTNVVVASTGVFNTITATGGALTVNSFTIGTYGYPAAAGNSADVLTIVTGNAVFVAPAPGTGANAALSNLTTVAINTNMNTFTAGFVTVARVIATSGALTGLTSFQATTGTFAGDVVISGTATVNVINVTGGSITAGTLAIGTYSLPTTIGATGTILTATTGNAQWVTPNLVQTQAYFNVYMNTASQVLGPSTTTSATLVADTKRFDTASQYSTGTGGYTITASGYYVFGANVCYTAGTGGMINLIIRLSGGTYVEPIAYGEAVGSGTAAQLHGSVMVVASSGEVYSFIGTASAAGTGRCTIVTVGTSHPTFWGYKVPDR